MPLLLAFVFAACGSATDRSDNADEFRERVTALGHDVRLIPEREGRPELVEGIVVSKDGIAKQFSFAFGPAPGRDLPPPANAADATWFSVGDEVYYWIDFTVQRAPAKQQNNFFEAAFAVEDTACQVVAQRNCGP